MANKIYVAQKGFVLNKEKNKILIQKYLDSKFVPEKIKGKYGIPGGKMDFGETPEETLIREILEETGIAVKPLFPFYTWTWTYNRNSSKVQIIANSWLATYQSGEIAKPNNQKETRLMKAKWIDINKLKIPEFVVDEQPIIEKFLEYQKKNPFIFS